MQGSALLLSAPRPPPFPPFPPSPPPPPPPIPSPVVNYDLEEPPDAPVDRHHHAKPTEAHDVLVR